MANNIPIKQIDGLSTALAGLVGISGTGLTDRIAFFNSSSSVTATENLQWIDGSSRLVIIGSGNTNATKTFQIQSASTSEILSVNDNGELSLTGNDATWVPLTLTDSSANVRLQLTSSGAATLLTLSDETGSNKIYLASTSGNTTDSFISSRLILGGSSLVGVNPRTSTKSQLELQGSTTEQTMLQIVDSSLNNAASRRIEMGYDTTTSYIYIRQADSDHIGLVANGSSWFNSGLTIGDTQGSELGKLVIKGDGASTSTINFIGVDNASNELYKVYDTGYWKFGNGAITGNVWWDFTPTLTGDMTVDGDVVGMKIYPELKAGAAYQDLIALQIKGNFNDNGYAGISQYLTQWIDGSTNEVVAQVNPDGSYQQMGDSFLLSVNSTVADNSSWIEFRSNQTTALGIRDHEYNNYIKFNSTTGNKRTEFVQDVRMDQGVSLYSQKTQRQLTTTDNSTNDIWSKTLSTNEAIFIRAIIIGDNGVSTATWEMNGAAKRGSGNIELIGLPSVNPFIETAAGGDVDMVVDTGDNSVAITVTGVTSETWSWKTLVYWDLM